MTLLTGNLITLLPVIMIIFLIKMDSTIHKSITKYFMYALIFCAVESVLEMITVMSFKFGSSAVLISRLANAFGFSIAPLIAFLMLSINLSDTRLEKYKVLFLFPLIINAILCFLSIRYNLVFHVTNENVYSRGPYFCVQLVINLFYIVLFIVLDLTKKNKYMHIDYYYLLINYLLAFAALFLQLMFPNLLLIWGSISLCLIFYYISFQNMLLWRDSLTSLFNRRIYEKTLQSYSKKNSVTVINIDLNFFKMINDTNGHLFGDQVLISCAKVLQKSFCEYGYVFRIGGDEFCVLCQNLKASVIEDLFEAMERELMPVKEDLHITKLLSYGYCAYDPKKHISIYEAVKTADSYMYEYKKIQKSVNRNFLAISEFLQ